jgi:dipeptide/tripeptide permease
MSGLDRAVVCLGAVVLVAGIVLLVLSHGTVAITVGVGLVGLSGIVFVALAFLMVGEGEERDEERDRKGSTDPHNRAT